MKKIRITPLSPTGEQPVDFYSWGDMTNIGIVSKREQFDEKLGEAFDSIEIKEDTETPETDYVLRVLGKEAGRVIIPFDMVVKDAYYDKETKEVVIVVRIGESEEKEIRFSVADLIDVYTGDEVTIHVEDNIISITKDVMDKFVDLRKSIDYEKQYRKEGDEKLNSLIEEEISNRKAEDAILEQKISESKDIIEDEIKEEKEAREESDKALEETIGNVATNLDNAVKNLAANDASLEAQIKAEKEAREASDSNLIQLVNNVETNLEESVKNLAANDASLEAQIKAEKESREQVDKELSQEIKDSTKDLEEKITKEISDRKDSDTELIKDYNDKIDKVQDNLQDLSKAHIESVSKLQEVDAQLHNEIIETRKECMSSPIPLDKIRALFKTQEETSNEEEPSIDTQSLDEEQEVEETKISFMDRIKSIF